MRIDKTSYGLYTLIAPRGQMLKGVYFFIDEKGHNPVMAFIEALPIREQAKVLAYVEELRKQGHFLRRPVADHLGDGVYELRPRDIRVFYCFFLKENAVLLHAIRKKTDKIPLRDMALCLKRREQMQAVENIEDMG
jgi:phage-related protein